MVSATHVASGKLRDEVYKQIKKWCGLNINYTIFILQEFILL